jgi:hypothetical protein
LRSPYLVFAERLEPLSDAGRKRKEEIALVEDNYHKDRIANRRLHPETLMTGYGYAPGLSEGSLKPPIFSPRPSFSRTPSKARIFRPYIGSTTAAPRREIGSGLFALQQSQPRNP